MTSTPIVLSDPRMLAEFLRQSEFKSFFEQRFAVPPDYAALLFKNGELIDAFKGGHFSVGGVVDRLKSIIGGSTHVSMMIADLKPFQVQTVLQAKSRDMIDIAGVVSMELQVNPDKPSNILGMMHGVSRVPSQDTAETRKALAKKDVLARIVPHLTDRVFEAAVGQMDATDLRGNIGLQDKIQADVMKEIERVVGDLGLIVRSTSIEWAQNAEEVAKESRLEAARQQDALDFQMELAKRDAKRTKDATIFTIESQRDIAQLENATSDELTHMALNSEIKFIDAREAAKRRQELEELDHQIIFLDKERATMFKNQIAAAQNETEVRAIQKRQLELDIEMSRIRELHMIEMKQSGAYSEIEITGRIQKQQREHISELQEIELRGEDVRAKIKRLEDEARRAHEIEMARLRATMTPEQLLANDAGLSPDVAAVLAEQARAKGGSNEEVMAVMRQMVEAATASQVRSEAQAREMFQMGMQGAVGVAAGAGGGSAAGTVGGAGQASPARPTMIDCPKCSSANEATSNFCFKCAQRLRA